MPNNRFRGDAQAVAQVNTVTPASVNIGNVFTITINGKDVTYTATAATVANVVTGLVAAITTAQATLQEFTEVTPTDSTTHVTLTAATAGVPFTSTSGATGGTATNTTATTTASSGPSHWDTAENWSLGAVPVAADDVFIENSAVDILYGIDHNTIALTSLNIAASYTGKIGLPDYREGLSYYEYREKYLKIRPGILRIGYGPGSGSGRIKIDTGSAAAVTAFVEGTGPNSQDGVPALVLNGSHASNVLNAYQGSIGLAVDAGSTANFPVVQVGYESSQSSDVSLACGSGCSLATFKAAGGTSEVRTNVSAMTVTAGEVSVLRSAAVSSLNLFGGTVNWRSDGALGSVPQIGAGAKLDFSQDLRARSVTGALYMLAGSTLLDPFRTVSWPAAPNGIHLDCSLEEVTLDLGKRQILTPTSY